MRKVLVAAALVAALVGMAASPAAAFTWSEQGEAGGLPGNANVVTGDGLVDTITGALGGAEDGFLICIPAPAVFSVTTIAHAGELVDLQLFLFDAAGVGVYSNDDTTGLRPELPAGHPAGPQTPGTYLLVVSGFDRDPVDGGGNPIFSGLPSDVLGPVDSDPVAGWVNVGGTGTFQLAVTGATASPCDPAAVCLVAPPVGTLPGNNIVAQPGVPVIGTAGPDVIYGTAGADRVAGLGGDDIVFGGGGNDQLFGGDGDDVICGGDGDDELSGGSGADALSGAGGNDKLAGGAGDDHLAGNEGDDRLAGGLDSDACFGGGQAADQLAECENP